MDLKNAKIAIVCDWLTNFAGAERVIYKLHQMFPDAPIYTSTFNAETVLTTNGSSSFAYCVEGV